LRRVDALAPDRLFRNWNRKPRFDTERMNVQAFGRDRRARPWTLPGGQAPDHPEDRKKGDDDPAAHALILLADELFGEVDEAVDVGEVADEPERHANGASAFPIDAHPEIVDREMRFVFRLPEAGG